MYILKIQIEFITAVKYSCIINGQIWKVHPMSLKSSSTGEKSSPNVGPAGSKEDEIETANALIQVAC
jgi:hypothetical protein